MLRILTLLLLLSPRLAAEEPVEIGPAKTTDRGVRVHEVRSPFQARPTLLQVLLPTKIEKGKTYPVIYLLPVEAGTEHRYGDGLTEVLQHDLHNRHSVVFVAPTFAHLPWYADHPTRADLRQESHFLRGIVPFVDRTYPVTPTLEGHYLLGFSKSGWGAWSLLLRHQETFHKAAAFDAPLMMDRPGKYGSGEIFATLANFEQYQVSRLLASRAGDLRKATRLILLGRGNFHAEHEQVHALMEKHQIRHVYQEEPIRKHDWHSGWVAEAVERLMEKGK